MVHQTCPVKLVKHQTNVVEDFRAKSNVRMNIISKDSVSVALATTLATKRVKVRAMFIKIFSIRNERNMSYLCARRGGELFFKMEDE